MPDHEALLAAIPAMSLMDSRRYLLADGVERWRDRQLDAVVAALGELPPDLTVVLIARAKAPAKLTKAVKAAEGEIHEFEAPKARELPRRLVADAQRLGFRLEPAAARLLVDRMGASPVRLQHELERLALWAGEGGEVDVADLDAMIADTSEAAVWSLSDALLERDAATALRIAERLIAQGENVTGLIYGLSNTVLSPGLAAQDVLRGAVPQPDLARRGPSAGSGSKPNSARNSTSSATARVFDGGRSYAGMAPAPGRSNRRAGRRCLGHWGGGPHTRSG